MSSRRSRWGILVIGAVILRLTPPLLWAQRLENIKAGKKYSSPLRNFSVTAPALCLGTKIQKSNEKNRGMVAFISDVGQLSRIDYIRLSPEDERALAESDPTARHGDYAKRLRALLEPSSATVVRQEPMEVEGAEALFALAKFPGGSAVETVTILEGQTNRTREDSVRGLLTFARGGFFYVLHHEVGINFDKIWPCGLKKQSGPHLSPEEQLQSAKDGVQNFYGAITFH